MGLRLLTAVFTLIFFVSCASSSTQHLSEEYNKPLSYSSVAILPIQADTFFEYFPNYAFGKVKPDQKDILNYFLPTIMERNSNTNVSGTLEEGITPDTFEMKSLALEGNEDLEIIGPKAGSQIGDNIGEQFVLILDQYNFQVYSIETGGGNYAGHEIEKESRLKFETKYLIWDNKNQKAAAWGKVNASSKYSALNSDEIYLDLLNDAVLKIIQKSPFSRAS